MFFLVLLPEYRNEHREWVALLSTLLVLSRLVFGACLAFSLSQKTQRERERFCHVTEVWQNHQLETRIIIIEENESSDEWRTSWKPIQSNEYRYRVSKRRIIYCVDTNNEKL